MDPQAAQRIGLNGPLLLQDFHLIDLLAHFDRGRIPERVVHAKGAGAYGEFEVTDDISDIVSPPYFVIQMAILTPSCRLPSTCSRRLGRRQNFKPAFRLLVGRKALRTVPVTLEGLLLSFTQKRAIGTGCLITLQYFSSVARLSSRFLFTPKSETFRLI